MSLTLAESKGINRSDRSPEAGALEKRKGLLGTLLRFMTCTNHPQTRATAGELLWSIHDGDGKCSHKPALRGLTKASALCAEIGYGNAAGLLFTKGITGPPPGTITEIDEPETKQSTEPESTRHPITALRDFPDPSAALSGMTEEEKEREAERLFAVFDKMDKNPVISTQGPDGTQKGVKDALRERYAAVDETWGDKEREEAEKQEKRDEEEAAKEMAAYRARMGKSGGA